MVFEVHGHVITVTFENEDSIIFEDEDHDILGLTEPIKNHISIRKGMSLQTTRETVIHELVHAFIFAYGYHVESEEAMCDFFGAQGDEIIRIADQIMKGVDE